MSRTSSVPWIFVGSGEFATGQCLERTGIGMIIQAFSTLLRKVHILWLERHMLIVIRTVVSQLCSRWLWPSSVPLQWQEKMYVGKKPTQDLDSVAHPKRNYLRLKHILRGFTPNVSAEDKEHFAILLYSYGSLYASLKQTAFELATFVVRCFQFVRSYD